MQGGGAESARFFADLGSSVLVSDLKSEAELSPSLTGLRKYPNIRFNLGRNDLGDVRWADVVVRNPGVKQSSPLITEARKEGKSVIMPSALFIKHCPCFSIGITGTRGKSTTTRMVYDALQKTVSQKVHLAGNVPHHSALKLVGTVGKNDIVVLELSSWELQGFREMGISPNIAVLTNIYPDHLNFYDSMDEYIGDKLNIVSFQKDTDHFVTGVDTFNEIGWRISNTRSRIHVVAPHHFRGQFTHLFGQHNRLNASLALKVLELLGVDSGQATRELSGFRGLPFRLEYLGTINNVPFFNDSTSTTPVACQTAIKAVRDRHPERRLILIYGGNSKNLPFEEMLTAVDDNVAAAYTLNGSFTAEVSSRLSAHIPQSGPYHDLGKLFTDLIAELKGDEVVLFSPAATSFATFKNEFDRGEQFSYHFRKWQKTNGT